MGLDLARPEIGSDRTLADPALARLQAFARLLDSAFVVPGTRIRFGLDALLGLIPGLGDVIAAALAGAIVLAAARRGAPGPVLVRMLANIGIDTLVGEIPLLGDVFDVGWRANQRNVALLELHLDAPARAARSGRRLVWLIGAGLVALLAAAAAIAWLLLRWLLGGGLT